MSLKLADRQQNAMSNGIFHLNSISRSCYMNSSSRFITGIWSIFTVSACLHGMRQAGGICIGTLMFLSSAGFIKSLPYVITFVGITNCFESLNMSKIHMHTAYYTLASIHVRWPGFAIDLLNSDYRFVPSALDPNESRVAPLSLTKLVVQKTHISICQTHFQFW